MRRPGRAPCQVWFRPGTANSFSDRLTVPGNRRNCPIAHPCGNVCVHVDARRKLHLVAELLVGNAGRWNQLQELLESLARELAHDQTIALVVRVRGVENLREGDVVSWKRRAQRRPRTLRHRGNHYQFAGGYARSIWYVAALAGNNNPAARVDAIVELRQFDRVALDIGIKGFFGQIQQVPVAPRP